MSAERLQQARELHKRGDFAGAIAAYDALLEEEPARADLWHLKGMAEHQSGRLDQARTSAGRAIAAGGEKPPFLLLEGRVLHDRGDLEEAERRFARLAALRPEWAPAHLELGSVRMDRGRTAEALESFRAAVSADPNHVRAWNNLAVALLTLERVEEARRAFNHTLTLDPGYALAHFNLARIHARGTDVRKALEHATAAVSSDPRNAEAHLLVGDLKRRQRDLPGALAAYTAAIQADPAHVTARSAQVEVLAEVGRYVEARREAVNIANRFPESLKAALPANLLLPHVYESVAHLEAVRNAYADGLERLHESAGRFRFGRPDQALAEARWTNFYLAYQGREDRALQKSYGDFLRRVLEPAVPELFSPAAPRGGGGRIRVGFLSHFFFNCTVGRYFASWITHLDRSRFETFVYYTNEWVADDTKRIAAACDHFRHLPGRAMLARARQVRDDALDILVYPEIGMHPDTFVFGALRLAPVQCAGWGHPDTTGLPGIDWFLSCESMEPPDAARHYGERLALLPGLGTRYAIPGGDMPATRGDYGLPDDRTLYFVPQSAFKIHPDNDELIAEVLARDPKSMAVMFAGNHEPITGALAGRLQASLERRGLDIGERIRFVMPPLPHGAYLQLNRLCDVMLDTVHWSGGNTSLDALSRSLPVVTWPGGLMRGRQSQAMLRILGADELVASSAEEYVETAVRLGTDAEERRAVSERIGANLGELFERDEPVRALEKFLEAAARGKAT